MMSQVQLLQTRLATITNISLQTATFPCAECVSNGHEPDSCGCGYCGSFGGCSWSCGGSGSGVRCITFPCDDCVTNGHKPDSCVADFAEVLEVVVGVANLTVNS